MELLRRRIVDGGGGGIAVYQRTIIGRWGDSQGEFGGFGTVGIIAILARYGRSQQRDRSGGGGGRGRRHCEIALPLTWQKQLVGVGGGSQIGGIVGGHFDDGKV